MCRAQAPREEPGARLVPNQVYARPAGEVLFMDLALPREGTGPFPAVVCLHGGGWVSGDRKQMAKTTEVLARRGFVAAAADYRLAPKHRFPAAVEDAKAAVRWLRQNATHYNIDAERIAVLGLAAGGHLACLVGVTEPGDGMEGTENIGQSSKVQAVASLSAPIDLLAVTDKVAVEKNLVPLLGATPEEKPERYQAASPNAYPPRNPPPFLLVHGGADPVVPAQQAHDFAAHLRKGGSPVRVLVLDGEGHTWNGPYLRKSIDVLLTFLDESLKK
jgi:acetyl esterase/lipase